MPDPSNRANRPDVDRGGPGSGRGRTVVLVSHSYVDEDPRVRREAEALEAAGWSVDLIGLRRPGEPATGALGAARLRRLSVQRHQGAGVATYLLEYASFFVRATLRLAADHRRRHYALVQVATLPDWLVFAALPLRLLGVPVVLDLHEAMPEFFAGRFPRLGHGPVRSLLLATERASVLAASHALAANVALRDRLVGLGLPGERVTVVPNAPSLARFDPAAHAGRPFMADGVLRLVYTGALTPTYDLGVAIDALARIRTLRPGLETSLDLYGRGDSEADLREQAAKGGLDGAVRFNGRIPVEAVPAVLAAADVGLAPVGLTAFTNLSFSTKLLEYGAMRLPVVAARLPLAERLLGPACVTFFEPEDPESLALAILGLVDAPGVRAAHVAALAERVGELAWEREAAAYVRLIDALASRRATRVAAG